MDTALVHSEDPPVIDTEGISHDDTNPELEILFTMNVDTQEVNIVVDKDNSEFKSDNIDNSNIAEEPVQTIETETSTKTKQPT